MTLINMMRTDHYLDDVEKIRNAFYNVFIALNPGIQREFSNILLNYKNQCYQRSVFFCFNVTAQ